MSTIAIIPAREGSKRVPGKNVALFKGKPMITHTIEQAIEATFFDRILVSTDDENIRKIVSDYPVELCGRSKDLATDKAPLLDVIRDLIRRLPLDSDIIIGLLLVTAPLRTVDDLRAAYELFMNSDKHDAVVSVCVDENPVDLSWRLRGKKLVPVFPDTYRLNISKKNRETTYHFNDALIFDTAMNFLKSKRNLFGDTPIPYIMPIERSVYIDYGFQLKIIQALEKEEE